MKVSQEILKLVPYKPGKPIAETQREYGLTDVIKLASNENPLGPSPRAMDAIKKALGNLHRYPDASNFSLIQKVSKIWSIPAEKMCVGNGSNELIDLLIRIYCEPGEAILTTEAAFVAYSVCAQAARVKNFTVPMAPNFKTNLPAMADFLENHPDGAKVRLVFIPNPNNPTGTYVNGEEIRSFLARAAKIPDLLVVFDEAYTEFVRADDYESGTKFLSQYANVCVLKTLSKAYGLAGLRVGFLLADKEIIELVNRVRNPFNVNELAQVAAEAAIDDYAFLERGKILNSRGLDYFYEELEALGLPCIESQANFVMFDTLRDVKKVNESLLRRGVILRPLLNYGFKTQLRMSVGTMAENQRAIRALSEVIGEIRS